MLGLHQCGVRKYKTENGKEKYKTFWKCGKRNEKTKQWGFMSEEHRIICSGKNK